jgi:predicted NACHT family NTPase
MGSSRERGFAVTPERLAFIEQKMREMGIDSREALAEATTLSPDVIYKKLFPGSKVDRSTVEAIAKTLKIQPTEIIEPERWYRRSKTAKSQASTNIDWHYVCRTMLDRQKKLSTNEVIASEAMQFDLLDDEIFISLALVERKEPERLSQNVHPAQPIEQYEEKPPIEYEQFREQILRQGKSDRIAIVGEPGAGKTTLLQHIAFWILDKELGLPIWISLGDLIKNGDLQRLKDYLTQVWLDDAVSNVTQDVKSDFLKQLNEQRVWLLLDGADEIVASSGIALREINNQLRGWLSQSSIILTCRINVWDVDINALRDFQTYRTKEFHYPTQVEQFIESGFRKSNQQSGERLKTELANTERTRLQQLVRNPLRLMMLCTTWHEQESLPATKAELYKRFASEFYKWNRSKWKKKDLNYAFFPNTVAKQEKLNKALGRLACRALDEESSPFRLPHNLVSDELGDPDEDGSNFWLALNLGWLQVARDSDKPLDKVYTFLHPTFQEYFASVAIDDWHDFLNHIPENPNHSNAKYRIFESRWQQVISLWFGRQDKRTSQQEKEQFITELTEFEDISGKYGFYSRQAYLVAARGIGQYESSKVYEIANQTVRWSFGYFDSAQKQ